MVLSDVDIRHALRLGTIAFHPLESMTPEQMGSCSVDFRLGYNFKRFTYKQQIEPIDPNKDVEKYMEAFNIPVGGQFVLRPQDFVLATTDEILELGDNMIARLEGRSSLARLGIIVHGTAGLFDPGWVGRAVLELGNLGPLPVILRPGMRICSFTFEQLSSPTSQPYRSKIGRKYAGQMAPAASKLAVEAENVAVQVDQMGRVIASGR